jgi:PAS domain-containing protein
MLDGGLRYRVWNDYLEQMLGISAADVIGLRLAEAPGLAPIGALAAELRRMQTGDQRSTREAEYRYPLGDRPWLRVKCTPVFEPGGAFGGVFILLERIDRERFAESSLAALRQALESVGEMVFEVDRHGHLLDANETALKLLGYERDEIEFVRGVLKAGDTAIDAGAHIGFFTMQMAAMVGPTGAVYAFEPFPPNADLLERSIDENRFEDRVTVQRGAVGATTGTATLTFPVETLNSGGAYLLRAGTAPLTGSGLAKGTFPSYGMWFNQYEFTYGLTDRIEAAAYLDLAKPNAHGLTYAGSKFRLRGRLFDEDVLPIDLGWYLEMEYHRNPQFDDQTLEFEMRIPMQKDIGPVSIMFNPIFEKPVTGPDRHLGFEFGYSAGIYYRWLKAISPGVEFYGGIGLSTNPDPHSEQQHYIFPVVKGDLPHGLEYNFGVGIGLTTGSDPVVVKFNLELEHFIGALFGPSSSNGWFW